MSGQTKNRIQRWVPKITLLLAIVVLPLYAFKISQNHDYTDFDVYYRAAVRAKSLLWNQIYTLQDGSSPYRYAPPWIVFFRPFAEISLSQAQLLWFGLQYFWFSLGFYFLYRTLALMIPEKAHARLITCLSFLFVLRFCLDTFTIGQVSSMMFLGYSFGLYGWTSNRASLASAGLFIPTSLKIGPGLLYGIFFSSPIYLKKRSLIQAFFSSFSILIFYMIIPFLGMGSFPLVRTLWKSWVQIVASDSQYYDASHYGSQSLNSVLLRLSKAGWIAPPLADRLHLGLSLLFCVGILWFWISRRPKSLYGRGLFFSLGVFAPIWLMPETFKYSLTPLAFPVAFLFASSKLDPWTLFSLVFGAFTLSLAGKDIIGDPLFFGLQLHSIPFFATFFLGIATFKKAWEESQPRGSLSQDIKISPKAITADDWGLSRAVNRGILELAKLGLIQRVSLMANTAYLEEGLRELKSLPNVELGIHFNLTYGKPLEPGHSLFTPSPGKVLLQWINPFKNQSIQLQFVRAELKAQLKKLQSLGIKVKHLDGHQHIHLLPGLLDGVSDILRTEGIQNVRLPYDPSLWWTGKTPLLFLALIAQRSFKRHDFKTLKFIYPSAENFLHPEQLKELIIENPEAEILVHPAEVNDIPTLEYPDSYTEGRVIEYQTLKGLKPFL